METIKSSNAISSWAYEDQPRFKLAKHGAYYLTTSELVSIIVNTGSKEQSAMDLAKGLLSLANNNLNELAKLSLQEVQKIKGLGFGKASSIIAAIELGRRTQSATPIEGTVFSRSSDLAKYLMSLLRDLSYEAFVVVYLNRANRIKHYEIVSTGGITGTVADPRVILRKALEQQATGIVLSHNHPSGNLMPSAADEEITQKIKQAAKYLDIMVLDHIIISDQGYFSFADEGLM